jgi:benzoyl-CoA reductase/2-hydroxyglutaryl-CoA dehydratase subunit BcrC/BadD/HgdB
VKRKVLNRFLVFYTNRMCTNYAVVFSVDQSLLQERTVSILLIENDTEFFNVVLFRFI